MFALFVLSNKFDWFECAFISTFNSVPHFPVLHFPPLNYRSCIFQSCSGPPLNFKFLDDQNQHSATAAADAAAGSVNELNEDVVVVIIQSSSNHSVGNDTDARHSRSFASIDRHYCTATITQMHRVESEIMHMKQCFLSVNDK